MSSPPAPRHSARIKSKKIPSQTEDRRQRDDDDEEKPKKARKDDKVYCVCKGKDDGRFMIACDFCNNWFHGDCVGISHRRARTIENYVCPMCEKDHPGHLEEEGEAENSEDEIQNGVSDGEASEPGRSSDRSAAKRRVSDSYSLGTVKQDINTSPATRLYSKMPGNVGAFGQHTTTNSVNNAHSSSHSGSINSILNVSNTPNREMTDFTFSQQKRPRSISNPPTSGSILAKDPNKSLPRDTAKTSPKLDPKIEELRSNVRKTLAEALAQPPPAPQPPQNSPKLNPAEPVKTESDETKSDPSSTSSETTASTKMDIVSPPAPQEPSEPKNPEPLAEPTSATSNGAADDHTTAAPEAMATELPEETVTEVKVEASGAPIAEEQTMTTPAEDASADAVKIEAAPTADGEAKEDVAVAAAAIEQPETKTETVAPTEEVKETPAEPAPKQEPMQIDGTTPNTESTAPQEGSASKPETKSEPTPPPPVQQLTPEELERLKTRAAEVAIEIENQLYLLHLRKGNEKEYLSKSRSLRFNLKDPKNHQLRDRVMSGEISAENLCKMSSAELANSDLADFRKKREEKVLSEILITDIRDSEMSWKLGSGAVLEHLKPKPTAAEAPVAAVLAGNLADDTDRALPKPPKKTIDHDAKQDEFAKIDSALEKHKPTRARLGSPPEEFPVTRNADLPPSPIRTTASPTTISPKSPPSPRRVKPKTNKKLSYVWKGSVDKTSGIQKFTIGGRHISGVDLDWSDFPGTLTVIGRVPIDSLLDYLHQVDKSTSSSNMTVLAFDPLTDEDDFCYYSMFEYFQSRQRAAVIKVPANNNTGLKEIFVLPLKAEEPAPKFLLRQKKAQITSKKDQLLGVFVASKDRRDFKREEPLPETPTSAEFPSPTPIGDALAAASILSNLSSTLSSLAAVAPGPPLPPTPPSHPLPQPPMLPPPQVLLPNPNMPPNPPFFNAPPGPTPPLNAFVQNQFNPPPYGMPFNNLTAAKFGPPPQTHTFTGNNTGYFTPNFPPSSLGTNLGTGAFLPPQQQQTNDLLTMLTTILKPGVKKEL